MGVTDYEPRVISQLLEFTYRYTSDILADARTYSEHAGKKQVDADDIRLAIDTLADESFTQPPPRQLLLEMAKEKNAVPLTPMKQMYGARLPNDRFCLLQPNYRWRDRNEMRQMGAELNSSSRSTMVANHPIVDHPTTSVVFNLDNDETETNSLKRTADDAGLDEDYDKE